MDHARDVPIDVNVARVAARAGIGEEPDRLAPRDVEGVLAAGRPEGLRVREYSYALFFDVGALHCRATPACHGCPFARSCLAHSQRDHGGRRPRNHTAYEGGFRHLRGAVLAAALQNPNLAHAALREHVTGLPLALLERFDDAVLSLVEDGLLPGGCAARSTPG